MAGFEQARINVVGEAVREWRGARLAPLYVAGIVLGIAFGVGGRWYQDAPPAPHRVIAPAQAAPAVVNVAAAELPNFADTVVPLDVVVAAVPAKAEVAPPIQETVAVPPPAPALAAPPAQPAAAAPPQVQAQNPPAPQPAAPAAAAAPAAPTLKPNFYLPEPKAGPMTDLEQRLLTSLNQERVNAGLAPYVLDAGLSRIARIRSQQLVDQKYFGHVDPYGYSMYVELLARFGYTYAWAGENLALNNYGAAESPERAMITLMKSPTHKANILAGDFFRVGIGEVTAADGSHYYAMIFLG